MCVYTHTSKSMKVRQKLDPTLIVSPPPRGSASPHTLKLRSYNHTKLNKSTLVRNSLNSQPATSSLTSSTHTAACLEAHHRPLPFSPYHPLASPPQSPRLSTAPLPPCCITSHRRHLAYLHKTAPAHASPLYPASCCRLRDSSASP
jgi:hypothetical protein